MALTLSANQSSSFPGVDCGQYLEYLFFGVTVTGNYTAGGDTMSFVGVSPLLTSALPPLPGSVNILSASAAAGHSGFIYFYRPGSPASISNGRMQVLTTGSGAGNALQELAAGGYPAAITSDSIFGTAAFPKA